MRTRSVVAAFAVVLSLGTAGCAFAPATTREARLTRTEPTSDSAAPATANVTVVFKNREFPPKGTATMAPCAVAACIDI